MKPVRIQRGALLLLLGVALVIALASCGVSESNESYGDTAWSIAEPWSGRAPQPRTLFPVRNNGMWGYMDKAGQLVIDYQFDGAEDFSEGLAVIRMGVQRGYINESGEIVIPVQYTHADAFSCGLALVGNVSNYGATDVERYIDKTGTPVLYPDVDWYSMGQFSEGLARVRFEYDDHSESWGYVDTSGKLVIWLPGVEHCRDFSEGLAYIDNGYIDRSAEFVIRQAFLFPTEFSDGLAVVDASPGWAIIDRAGAVVADLDFLPSGVLQVARGLHEGRAAVLVDGGWGYLDGAGELVIPGQFYQVWDFSGGLARVDDANGKMAYVDLDGNYVWQEE